MAVTAFILSSSLIFRVIILWIAITDFLPRVSGHRETVNSRMHNFMGPTVTSRQRMFTSDTDAGTINKSLPQSRLFQSHPQGWQPNIGDLFQNQATPSESGKQFFKTWTSSDSKQDKNVGSSLSRDEFLQSKLLNNRVSGFQSWSSKPTFINSGKFSVTDKLGNEDNNATTNAMMKKFFQQFQSINNINNMSNDGTVEFRTWSSGQSPSMKSGDSIPTPVFYKFRENGNDSKHNNKQPEPISLNGNIDILPFQNLQQKENMGVERLQPFPNVGHTINPRSFTKPSETFQTMFERLMLPSAVPFSSEHFINMPESIKKRIEARRALQAKNANKAEREKGTKIDRLFKKLPLSDFKRDHLKVSSHEIQKRLKQIVADWVSNQTDSRKQNESKVQQTGGKTDLSKVNVYNQTDQIVNDKNNKSYLDKVHVIETRSPLTTQTPAVSTSNQPEGTLNNNQRYVELVIDSNKTAPKHMPQITLPVEDAGRKHFKKQVQDKLSTVSVKRFQTSKSGSNMEPSSNERLYISLRNGLLNDGVFKRNETKYLPDLKSGVAENNRSGKHINGTKSLVLQLTNETVSIKHNESFLISPDNSNISIPLQIPKSFNTKAAHIVDTTGNIGKKAPFTTSRYFVTQSNVNVDINTEQNRFTTQPFSPHTSAASSVVSKTTGKEQKNNFSRDQYSAVTQQHIAKQNKSKDMYMSHMQETTTQSKIITAEPKTESLKTIADNKLSSHLNMESKENMTGNQNVTSPTFIKDNPSVTTKSTPEKGVAMGFEMTNNDVLLSKSVGVNMSLSKISHTVPTINAIRTSEMYQKSKLSTNSPLQTTGENSQYFSVQANDYNTKLPTEPTHNPHMSAEPILEATSLSNINNKSNDSFLFDLKANENIDKTTNQRQTIQNKLTSTEAIQVVKVLKFPVKGNFVNINTGQVVLKTTDIPLFKNVVTENINEHVSLGAANVKSATIDAYKTTLAYHQSANPLTQAGNEKIKFTQEDVEVPTDRDFVYSSMTTTESVYPIKSKSPITFIASQDDQKIGSNTHITSNVSDITKSNKAEVTDIPSTSRMNAYSSTPSVTEYQSTSGTDTHSSHITKHIQTKGRIISEDSSSTTRQVKTDVTYEAQISLISQSAESQGKKKASQITKPYKPLQHTTAQPIITTDLPKTINVKQNTKGHNDYRQSLGTHSESIKMIGVTKSLSRALAQQTDILYKNSNGMKSKSVQFQRISTRPKTLLPRLVTESPSEILPVVKEDHLKRAHMEGVNGITYKSQQIIKRTLGPKEYYYTTTPFVGQSSKIITSNKPDIMNITTRINGKQENRENRKVKTKKEKKVSERKTDVTPRMTKAKSNGKQVVAKVTASSKQPESHHETTERKIVKDVLTTIRPEIKQLKYFTRSEVTRIHRNDPHPFSSNTLLKDEHTKNTRNINAISPKTDKSLRKTNNQKVPYDVLVDKVKERNTKLLQNNLKANILQHNIGNNSGVKISLFPLFKEPSEHNKIKIDQITQKSKVISYDPQRPVLPGNAGRMQKSKRMNKFSTFDRVAGSRKWKPRRNKFEELLLELTRKRNARVTPKPKLQMSDKKVQRQKPKYSSVSSFHDNKNAMSVTNIMKKMKGMQINTKPEIRRSKLDNPIERGNFDISSSTRNKNDQNRIGIQRDTKPGIGSTKQLEQLLAENTGNSFQLFSLPKYTRKQESKPANGVYLQPHSKTSPVSILDLLHNGITKIKTKKNLEPVLPKLAGRVFKNNILNKSPLKTSTEPSNPLLKQRLPQRDPSPEIKPVWLQNVLQPSGVKHNVIGYMQNEVGQNEKRSMGIGKPREFKKEIKDQINENKPVNSETKSGINILNSLLSGQVKRDGQVQLFNIAPPSSYTKVSKMLFDPSIIPKNTPNNPFKPLNVDRISHRKSYLDAANLNKGNNVNRQQNSKSNINNKERTFHLTPSHVKKENVLTRNPDKHESRNMVIRRWLDKFKSESTQNPIPKTQISKQSLESRTSRPNQDVRFRGIKPKRINLFNSFESSPVFTPVARDKTSIYRDEPKQNALHRERSAFKTRKNKQFMTEYRPNDEIPKKPTYQHKQVAASKPKVINLWDISSPIFGNALLEQISAVDNREQNSVPIINHKVTDSVGNRKETNKKKDIHKKLAPFNGSIKKLLFPKQFVF